MTNEELIKKAVITTDNLTNPTAGGLLNPRQSQRFFQLVVDLTKLKSSARIERFNESKAEIDKIDTAITRVAVPHSEANSTAIRRGIKTSKISLEPKRIVVPFSVSNDFLLTNIEGENAEDVVIQSMARTLANNLEELYLHGDTLGPAVLESTIFEDGSESKYVKDDFLALGDGWLKRARGGHVVDANGVNISSSLFSKFIKEMPDKWKRDRANLRFFSSSDHEQNYRQAVSGRATASGDIALSTTQNLTPYGIDLVPVPLLFEQPPVVLHVKLVDTEAVHLGGFKSVSDVVVTKSGLGETVTPYSATADYTLNAATGTIARRAGGKIPSGDEVKVTFKTLGQILFTTSRNLILGISRDISILKDTDIYSDQRQYAIHTKVAVQVAEVDAMVLGINIGLS